MLLRNQKSLGVVKSRHALYAGAGLFGMIGGGNRRKNNHRRGLNAHRGNTF